MTEVSQSIRLMARLAEVLSRPADFWPHDMTGLASLSPDAAAELYRGEQGPLFQKALALDLELAGMDIGESFMVELRTVPDVADVVRMACAPVSDIMVALRHLAACVYCKAVNGAVRKADRDAMLDMLGTDGLLTAQRQAHVFWPSLADLARTGTGLAVPPAEPPVADGAWSRPATSLVIAGKPPAIRHAYAILLAHVGAVSATIGRILRARLGAVPDEFASLRLSPQQDREIRDLLTRKVPAWSTTIA